MKWILVICIAEFIFWGLLNLLIPESYFEIYEKFHIKLFLDITQILHYVVIIVFIYFFYKNYSSISVVESTSLLMKKIINRGEKEMDFIQNELITFSIIAITVIFLGLLTKFIEEKYKK